MASHRCLCLDIGMLRDSQAEKTSLGTKEYLKNTVRRTAPAISKKVTIASETDDTTPACISTCEIGSLISRMPCVMENAHKNPTERIVPTSIAAVVRAIYLLYYRRSDYSFLSYHLYADPLLEGIAHLFCKTLIDGLEDHLGEALLARFLVAGSEHNELREP